MTRCIHHNACTAGFFTLMQGDQLTSSGPVVLGCSSNEQNDTPVWSERPSRLLKARVQRLTVPPSYRSGSSFLCVTLRDKAGV